MDLLRKAKKAVALQVGGHGERIAQCREAKLITRKTIPMQVDGEPCRLQPSVISIHLRNQANMVAKSKKTTSLRLHLPDGSTRLRIQVSRIGINDYETYHYDKEKLKAVSVPLSLIVVESNADLEAVREQIDRLAKDMLSASPTISGAGAPPKPSCQPLSSKWCFLDSTTAERFFRIDRGQEHLHYITDISSEDLYILDPELESVLTLGEHPSDDAAAVPGEPASKAAAAGTDSVVGGVPATSSLTEEPLCVPAAADVASSSSVAAAAAAGAPVLQMAIRPSRPFTLPATPPRSPLVDAHVVGTAASATLHEKVLQDSSKRGDLKKFVEAHRAGASMLCLDKEGMSVLHNSARFGHKAIVEYILEHGPKEIIDMLDSEKGQTALHKAAWYQRRTICGMLVAAGSSLLVKDKQGNTPKMQAMRAEDGELAAYFDSQERFLKLHEDDALVTAV